MRCRSLRTTSSGDVFLPRMRLMFQERRSLVRRSRIGRRLTQRREGAKARRVLANAERGMRNEINSESFQPRMNADKHGSNLNFNAKTQRRKDAKTRRTPRTKHENEEEDCQPRTYVRSHV